MSALQGAGLAAGVASGQEAPAAESLNLYRFPALYDTLKAPDDEDITAVRSLIQRCVGEGPWSILDPACGPGNWLKPFAAEASRLAGNDNCPEMVEYTRATTGAHTVLGDMFELAFDEPFDVILEASGVTSLLPDVGTLTRWVRSFRPHLSSRGVVILLLNFEVPLPKRLPATLWRTPWRAVPGGRARIRYELLGVEPDLRTQHIRRTVETQGGDWPARIIESYDLRIWRAGDLAALRDVPGFELEACVDAARPDKLHAAPSGERLLVFRPV
ncbi:MAG: methyltransferase domain-containing protein [Planctomycetes bacterium]|nr:methyltransferase domain-containing protein [Planctomycetota bacterium]